MAEMKYSEKGLWIQKEGELYRLGISEKGQDDIGEVAFIELPDEADQINVGDALLNVEGAKAVTELESPLAGTVVRYNQELEDQPEKLNTPEKENNWIVEMKDVDPAAFAQLSDKA